MDFILLFLCKTFGYNGVVKVLIFGSKGYLGQLFASQYPDARLSDADIADSLAVTTVLDQEKPDVVINAAGKTGRPNVDWCEDHKEETLRSNVTGPLVLLQECGKRGIYWVHLGSGCIYTGDNDGKGFTEMDPPNFGGSFYSRTKAWSDQILRDFPHVLVLRIRMPFDGSTHSRSLISKISKYAKVLDEKNSLTYLPDFMKAADTLIKKKKTGIYNVVNPGAMSPWDIMNLYKEIVDPTKQCTRIDADQLQTMVKAGRSNCILSGKKLEAEGVHMRPVEEAVREALESI